MYSVKIVFIVTDVTINGFSIMDTGDLERLQHQVLSPIEVTIESTQNQHFPPIAHQNVVSFDTSKVIISHRK